MQTKDVRIVVLGCQKVAIDVIEFIRNGHEAIGIDNDGYAVCPKLVGVVTHDENRDKLFGDQTVKEYCDKNEILNFRFEGKVEKDIIKDLNPDIIFSIYYRKILPKSIIDIPKMGIINLHPSNLEKDRGPTPTLYSVLRGDYVAYSTLHYIDQNVDSGDIISNKGVSIRTKTGFEVSKIMMNNGLELFRECYSSIIMGSNERTPQDHSRATYNPPFNNKMRIINWSMAYSDISNHIMAFKHPYSGSVAYTQDGIKILVKEIKKIEKIKRILNGPGFFYLEEDKIIVQSRDSQIEIIDFDIDHGTLNTYGRFKNS